jgi:RNA polymerase sigma factor (sigma-70 family)
MYKTYFPLIQVYIQRNSGSFEDAEDVFQDGMMALFDRSRDNTFCLNAGLQTYFFAICRNIWLQRLERKGRLQYRGELMVLEKEVKYSRGSDEEKEDNLARQRLFYRHFSNIPKDCQKILKLFFQKVPVREIACEMGFKDENYTKVRKYLCKNMLRKRILRDPESKSFLFNEATG